MIPTRASEILPASERSNDAESALESPLLRELEASRRNEAVLRDFIETSTIALHWVGADGTILWANQAELDLLGYTREQYLGRNIADFHADEPVINDILACLRRGETLRDYPARLQHRDGSIRHVLINSSVLFEDGEFVHTRCFTRDITDLKREQEARQAQMAAELADTKLLQDISAQLIEQGDEDALYAKIIDAVATIMRSDFATMQVLYPDRGPKGELRLLASRGLTPEGQKIWEWVRLDTDSTCGQALRTGKRAIAFDVETCDFLAGTPGMAALLDGGIRSAQSTPLFSRGGRMLGMVSSHWRKPHAPSERDLRLLDILARQAADLIERRQADQALRDSERRLHELVEAIPAAVYTTDADGRITFFNQAAVKFSGRVPELGNDSWCVTWKLYNTDGSPLPHDQCPMAVALKEQRPVLGCEAIAERPDGQRRTFTPYPTPLFDANGRLTGAVNMLVDITDIKSAERTLRQSEERFRAIVDATPECVKVVDADGTLLLMNESGLAMIQAADLEEVIGKSIYDVISPEDRALYQEFNERVCHGAKGSLEFDIIGLQGRRRRMETHAVPLQHPDGAITQLGITRDITERKRSEDAINTLNGQLKADLAAMTRMQQLSTRLIQAGGFAELLGEILDVGISITAADMGNIQLLDDANRLKIVADRGFKAPFLEFFDEVHDGLAACGTALRQGERVIVEDVARDPIFTGTPAREAMLAAGARAVQSTPLVSRTGKALGMFSTHYREPHRPSERELRLLDLLARQAADLIERKRAEETRGQLSAIVEASGDAIYTYDFNGTILTWNRAAEDLYGYRSHEIIGQPAEMIVPPEQRDQLRGLIDSGQKAAHIIRNLETTRKRRDGSIFPSVLTISPIRDETGKTVALSVIARDITERKRVEDELRRANEDLEQFAYSASHDLQEPLRTIKIYSELLADRLGSLVEGESAEFLGFLQSAATRMELLVRDLLAYTQVTRLDAPMEETDTNDTLAEALANLAGAIAESGATVSCGKLPTLRVHGTHLRQLFQNLIGNAIKYRSEDRTPAVHIETERRDNHWVFTVRDNGIGIPPEFKEQIFGLFSRLHNADRYVGTGIGLAICQRIVERYQGRIWVDSEPGFGSEFRFTLPV